MLCPPPPITSGGARLGHPCRHGRPALDLLSTPEHSRTPEHSPSCRPRCCVCSWLSGRLAGSLGHLRIPGTPARRSQHPRCIRPISSHLLEVLCGGSHSRRSWTCPRHRSGLQRRPPLPMRWHGQRQTLAWLGIDRVHGIIRQHNTFCFPSQPPSASSKSH